MEPVKPGFVNVVRFEPEPGLVGRMGEHGECEQHMKVSDSK